MDYGRRHSGAPLSDYKQFSEEITDQYISSLGILYPFEFKQPYYHEDYQAMIYLFNSPYQSPYLEQSGFNESLPYMTNPVYGKDFKFNLWYPTIPTGIPPYNPTSDDPTINIGKKCCTPDIQIAGSNTVSVNDTSSYTVIGAKKGCEYNINAYRGIVIAGTYHAPATAGPDTIYITPFIGNDRAEVCVTKKIMVTSIVACSGVIGYTSTSMGHGTTQTLTVSGGIESDSYTWEITSGGGSLNTTTGTSVIFTAPVTSGPTSAAITTAGYSSTPELEDAIYSYFNFADLPYIENGLDYVYYEYPDSGISDKLTEQGFTNVPDGSWAGGRWFNSDIWVIVKIDYYVRYSWRCAIWFDTSGTLTDVTTITLKCDGNIVDTLQITSS